MNRGDFVRKEDRKVEGMGETERRFHKEDSMPIRKKHLVCKIGMYFIDVVVITVFL